MFITGADWACAERAGLELCVGKGKHVASPMPAPAAHIYGPIRRMSSPSNSRGTREVALGTYLLVCTSLHGLQVLAS